MLNPTFSVGGGTGGGAPPAALPLRRYIGSQVLSASGTWQKADAPSGVLEGFDLSLVSVDVECIGGGGGGAGVSSAMAYGGDGSRPTHRTVPFLDLPETVAVSIGAGGPRSTSTTGNSGGATTFGDILSAVGGLPGSASVRPYDSTVFLYGPGCGCGGASGPPWGINGGPSCAAYPDRSLPGGLGGVSSSFAEMQGLNASTPFEYGSGGARIFSNPAGDGGWPGGGGGTAGSNGVSGGKGGDGAVRLHYYTTEPA